jgi:hypothetical protein
MWPASVFNNLFYFILDFFCHGPKRLKKVCYPSSRLSVAVILLSATQRTECLEPPALWVVTVAKELGISQGFPPGGQYTSGPHKVIVQ